MVNRGDTIIEGLLCATIRKLKWNDVHDSARVIVIIKITSRRYSVYDYKGCVDCELNQI